MLANLISGNQPTDFVHLMNQKAAELGMTNTTYYNCSGRKQVPLTACIKCKELTQMAITSLQLEI